MKVFIPALALIAATPACAAPPKAKAPIVDDEVQKILNTRSVPRVFYTMDQFIDQCDNTSGEERADCGSQIGGIVMGITEGISVTDLPWTFCLPSGIAQLSLMDEFIAAWKRFTSTRSVTKGAYVPVASILNNYLAIQYPCPKGEGR